MCILPIAQPNLNSHADESSDTDPSRVANRRCRQGKLTVFLRDSITNLGECIDVNKSTKQALPKDDPKYEVHARYKAEQSVEGQQDQVSYLKQRRKVQPVDAKEWRGRARNKNASLVDSVVSRVECTEMGEGRFLKREQQSRRDTLVDGVLCNVDQQEWKHTRLCKRGGIHWFK